MKKITILVLSSVLMMVTVACGNTAKTTSDAPNSTDKTGEVPTADTTANANKDATNNVRKDQLNSDIRSGEQRNNMTGGDADRANGELSNEVRSKLEANIPNGKLTISAKDGAVIVSGTVQTQSQLGKIESLVKEIKGVKSVSVKAKVSTAVPDKK